MIQLFCIVDRDPDAIQLLMVKFNDEMNLVPVWKKQTSAEAYLSKNSYGSDYSVKEFTFQLFEECREWAKASGIALFIQLVE